MAQFPPYRLSVTDNLRTGNAVNANRTKSGIPLAGAEAQAVLVISLGTPTVAAANNIATSQTITGASDAVIAGTLASGGVATLDVGRCVSVTSANAGDTTQTATVYGTDVHGASLREVLTFAGAATVSGGKAFKTVTRIAISATLLGAFTAGTTDKLGLPYRPVVGGFLGGIAGENTSDAGTYVAPSRVTATGTTVDVRGTYDPAGTLTGSLAIAVRIAVQNGPTDADAFGVAQYNG